MIRLPWVALDPVFSIAGLASITKIVLMPYI
jgi:hypothetical protein